MRRFQVMFEGLVTFGKSWHKVTQKKEKIVQNLRRKIKSNDQSQKKKVEKVSHNLRHAGKILQNLREKNIDVTMNSCHVYLNH